MIDISILDKLSYKSNLNKSLKNTLRKFNKEDIMTELLDIRGFYEKNQLLTTIKFDYRIKSFQSSLLKYDKYFPSTELKKCFNDLLGFRIVIDNYNELDNISLENFRIADMRNGKANDDGYRGIHLYYQKSNRHYPIELQINTVKDRIFNDWLHQELYKYVSNNNIGIELRKKYDDGIITSLEDFKGELKKHVLYNI
ncbi:hypothetical protein [Clostridium perfringens]|uniref:hypothetical protein n=1 Tax=Clostridium perfringens TaxID=1502 RepID=UPI00156F217E|nr:hypothetical protein [Clostridium perfringens]MDU7944367.1 hypothetical protein [Streptococcus salivarius]MDU7977665.1 hypothetical protein [Clostridioides difficile]MBI6024503.1 hypothetical protein [Clostridium perfringens]MBI6048510.1 hypothetical protein [Clostridium perfringens]MDK0553745.1 hypothetical protein [Clostridium perfringens]